MAGKNQLVIHTGGLPLFYYILYSLLLVITTFFLSPLLFSFSNATSILSMEDLSWFQLTLSLVLVSLFFIFYHFSTFILSNRLVLSGDSLHCRYFSKRYQLRDYFLTPVISHHLSLQGIFLVSSDNFKSFPRDFVLMTRAQMRQYLLASEGITGAGRCYANLKSLLFLYPDGRSRLVYTQPFSSSSVRKLLETLSLRGMVIISPLPAAQKVNSP